MRLLALGASLVCLFYAMPTLADGGFEGVPASAFAKPASQPKEENLWGDGSGAGKDPNDGRLYNRPKPGGAVGTKCKTLRERLRARMQGQPDDDVRGCISDKSQANANTEPDPNSLREQLKRKMREGQRASHRGPGECIDGRYAVTGTFAPPTTLEIAHVGSNQVLRGNWGAFNEEVRGDPIIGTRIVAHGENMFGTTVLTATCTGGTLSGSFTNSRGFTGAMAGQLIN